MIKVEISNVKGCEAELNIEVRGDDEKVYNELLQLFIYLMSNDKTTTILNAALRKSMEVFRNDETATVLNPSLIKSMEVIRNDKNK